MILSGLEISNNLRIGRNSDRPTVLVILFVSLSPCPRSIFSILSCSVLEVCPWGTASPSSLPPLVRVVSHWPPVSFRQGETPAGDLGVRGEVRVFIPLGVTTLLLPSMVWSACVLCSSSFYKASPCPWLQIWCADQAWGVKAAPLLLVPEGFTISWLWAPESPIRIYGPCT